MERRKALCLGRLALPGWWEPSDGLIDLDTCGNKFSVIYLRRLGPITSQNRASSWRTGVQICEPTGDILDLTNKLQKQELESINLGTIAALQKPVGLQNFATGHNWAFEELSLSWTSLWDCASEYFSFFSLEVAQWGEWDPCEYCLTIWTLGCLSVYPVDKTIWWHNRQT